MTWTKILNLKYLAMGLGVLFVVYHLAQIGGGVADLWQLAWRANAAPTASTPAPKALVGLQTDSSIWPTRVVIDSVGIDLALTGSIEKEGQWLISETGANFATNTAIPNGQTGNTALFGHDRPKLFRNLHDLKEGAVVKVITKYMVYYYTVTGSKTVAPSDVSVMNQTTDPILTLITCDGWLSENRLVINAKFTRSEATPDNFLVHGLALGKGLVSLTFDDGLKTSYTQALPLLKQYQAKATFYVATGLLGDNANYYMNSNEVRDLFARGYEIASHTATHPNLTTLAATQVAYELDQPKSYLNDLLGVVPKNFASPYGEHNAQVGTAIDAAYSSHRGSDIGLNDPTDFDWYNINIEVVKSSTSLEEIKGWINDAAEKKFWLVLVYHNLSNSSNEYDSTPANFEATLQYLRTAKVDLSTIQDALNKILH